MEQTEGTFDADAFVVGYHTLSAVSPEIDQRVHAAVSSLHTSAQFAAAVQDLTDAGYATGEGYITFEAAFRFGWRWANNAVRSNAISLLRDSLVVSSLVPVQKGPDEAWISCCAALRASELLGLGPQPLADLVRPLLDRRRARRLRMMLDCSRGTFLEKGGLAEVEGSEGFEFRFIACDAVS